MIGWIYWDPSNVFFMVPVLNVPVTWYGVFFALGFWIGFKIFSFMVGRTLEKKDTAVFSERLLLYVIIATVIGARLGHILFYEHPMEYFRNPVSILKTWEGGLASHGAIIAIILAIFFFSHRVRKEYPQFTVLTLLDYLAIPAMFAGCMIRVGNFFNQEILGTPTESPLGIIFGHPADGGLVLPRHPAQLYEAAFYLGLFLFLSFLWYSKKDRLIPGRLAGLTLTLTFLFRFFIEFIKTEQSLWFDARGQGLLMGQVLSLPIIAIGLIMLLRKPKATLVKSETKPV
jgi:phosphatidylglycerol:prolipoprotein diacylglycerol transferase